MSPTDVENASRYLEITPKEFLYEWAEEEKQGWMRLKSRPFPGEPKGGEACVFLDDNSQCTIYEHRPIQCRTFPYWGRLLYSRENWLNESCVPDDVEGKHWNPEDGGCEGIEHPDAPIVPFSYIRQQLLMQYAVNRAMPGENKA